MAKACSTNVARSLGYLGKVSQEDRIYGSPVTILGPMQGQMRSYHVSGKSPKEEYLEMKRRAKDHIECVKREFRL